MKTTLNAAQRLTEHTKGKRVSAQRGSAEKIGQTKVLFSHEPPSLGAVWHVGDSPANAATRYGWAFYRISLLPD